MDKLSTAHWHKEFTLSNDVKQRLKDILINTHFNSTAAKGKAALEVLPQEIHDRLDAILNDGEKLTLAIHNLPEDDFRPLRPSTDNSLALRERLIERGIEATQQPKPPRKIFNLLMEALYAAYSISAPSSLTLPRQIIDGEMRWTGGYLHQDSWRFIALASPRNFEHAATRITDMDSVFKEMPDERLEAIKLQGNFADLKSYKYAYLDKAASGLRIAIDKQSSDPEAVKEFNSALNKHSVDTILSANTLLLFPNTLFYHQSRRGKYMMLNDYGREVHNASGGYPGKSY